MGCRLFGQGSKAKHRRVASQAGFILIKLKMTLFYYLKGISIQDVICRKISSNYGRIFKTVFFSRRVTYITIIHNEAFWPKGLKLKDFV